MPRRRSAPGPGRGDIVDGTVVAHAAAHGAEIVTSDRGDVVCLLDALGTTVPVVDV